MSDDTSDLDKLFPMIPPVLEIRGTVYPIKKITVDIMGSVNVLTDKAYAVIDLTNLQDEVDVAAIAAGAIGALIDGGDTQRRMATVVTKLTGMEPSLFETLQIEELVDLIVCIVKANQDFFSMRLAPKMRSAMQVLRAQTQT